jgi:hypothetical protein
MSARLAGAVAWLEQHATDYPNGLCGEWLAAEARWYGHDHDTLI